MKNKQIVNLIKDLQLHMAHEVELYITDTIINVDVVVNDMYYFKNGKQIYFGDILDDTLVVYFYVEMKYSAPIYSYTLDKSQQIEYLCNKKMINNLLVTVA